MNLRPRQSSYIERVRVLAVQTANIKWSYHAQERMLERGIALRVAIQVIRTGQIKGELEPGQNEGEWKVKIVRTVEGRREVGAVLLVIRNASILVKTVEWEDIR